MAEISKLSADPEMVKGKWFPFEDDVEFLIAYSETGKFRKKQQKLMMKARLSKGNRDITDLTDQVNVEAAYKTILLDWKGLTEDGKPFEFNLANVKRFLSAPNGALGFILAEANTKGNFQPEQEDEDVDETENEPAKKGALTADKQELKSGAGVGA